MKTMFAVGKVYRTTKPIRSCVTTIREGTLVEVIRHDDDDPWARVRVLGGMRIGRAIWARIGEVEEVEA